MATNKTLICPQAIMFPVVGSCIAAWRSCSEVQRRNIPLCREDWEENPELKSADRLFPQAQAWNVKAPLYKDVEDYPGQRR
jgi:hypothetical protein